MSAAENGPGKNADLVTVDITKKEAAPAPPSAQKTKVEVEEKKLKERCVPCMKVLFIILGIFAVVVAVALKIVTILTSIATKVYDADQSNRIAAMVLLAVTAAITICMVIYLEVATFKRHRKPMIGSALVILIIVLIQALIGGISVTVQSNDEAKLLKSLADSFKLAKEGIPRHYRIWAMTQNDLTCCGIHGPEDYRPVDIPPFFAPDVPISCCPGYDPSKSDLVQERERELCKSRRSYHTNGCSDRVLTVFKDTATMVLTVDILLIVTEIALVVACYILNRQLKTRNVNKISPK